MDENTQVVSDDEVNANINLAENSSAKWTKDLFSKFYENPCENEKRTEIVQKLNGKILHLSSDMATAEGRSFLGKNEIKIFTYDFI